MAQCKYCGRRIRKNQYICPWCKAWLTEQGAWQQSLPDVTDWDSQYEFQYSEMLCDMCGKEGALLRSDNGYYCTKCWQIWKH